VLIPEKCNLKKIMFKGNACLACFLYLAGWLFLTGCVPAWHTTYSNTPNRCVLAVSLQHTPTAVFSNPCRYSTFATRKDGTYFTNKALTQAAEDLAEAKHEYGDFQKDLVAQVVDVAATFVEVWEAVASALSELDVLSGFADLATSDPGRWAGRRASLVWERVFVFCFPDTFGRKIACMYLILL
jgi:hypothetical protein